MLFVFALVIISVYIYIKYINIPREDYEILSPHYADKCWTASEEVIDTEIYPFQIDIPDSDLKDLQRRLEGTRLPTPSLKDARFHYGVNSKFMEDFLTYWKESFDWRKQEEQLNMFPHFKTKIEGLDIHFIHIRPEKTSNKIEPKPILFCHGWPGSVYEFYKIIPMLIDPLSYGGNETDLFEVIVPSIPGYGFSQAPEVKGFNSIGCARIFHKLMTRLGHRTYYVQGGDWGAEITTNMAMLYPSAVKGIHFNFGVTRLPPLTILKLIIGSYVPSLFLHGDDAKKFYPLKDYFFNQLQETGYMHLQATKPDTVGYALNDSPVGLAAYFLEKFSTWTNQRGRDKESGDILKYFSYDELLTNILIYWFNGNITSSMRFYKETFKVAGGKMGVKVRVPAGFACFPNEFLPTLKSQLEAKYTRLLSFTRMSDGGHFAAFEVPDLLAEDIRNFVRLIEREETKEAFESQCMQEFHHTHLDRMESGSSVEVYS